MFQCALVPLCFHRHVCLLAARTSLAHKTLNPLLPHIIPYPLYPHPFSCIPTRSDISANKFTGTPPTAFSSWFIGTPQGTLNLQKNFFSGQSSGGFKAGKRKFCPTYLVGTYARTFLRKYGAKPRSRVSRNCLSSSLTCLLPNQKAGRRCLRYDHTLKVSPYQPLIPSLLLLSSSHPPLPSSRSSAAVLVVLLTSLQCLSCCSLHCSACCVAHFTEVLVASLTAPRPETVVAHAAAFTLPGTVALLW